MSDHVLRLSQRAGAAFMLVLARTDPKGRTELRAHAKLWDALEAGAGNGKPDWGIKPGTSDVRLTPDGTDYLREITSKLIDAGCPGQAAQGLHELHEAVEAVKSTTKVAREP